MGPEVVGGVPHSGPEIVDVPRNGPEVVGVPGSLLCSCDRNSVFLS